MIGQLGSTKRNASPEARRGSQIAFGPYLLDRDAMQLFRGNDVVPLTARALTVLEVLLEEPGRLVSKDELVSRAWSGRPVADTAVAKRLHELRVALGDDARTPRYVSTVYGRGFRFVAPVVIACSADELVGRGAALARLNGAFRAARGGERVLAFVSGEAGIGKSALVRRLLAEDQASGPGSAANAFVVEERCGPDGPPGPLFGALAQLLSGSAGCDVDVILARHAPTWHRALHAAVEAQAIGRSTPEGSDAHLSWEELSLGLEQISTLRPLILVLEDLHLANTALLDGLDRLTRGVTQARILIIATLRELPAFALDTRLDPVLAAELGRPGVTRVPLARLSIDDTESHLSARFGVRDGVRLAPDVHAYALGLPLYLAWLADWVDGLEAPVVENRAATREAMGAGLRRLFDIQLAALKPASLTMLETAAVLGVEFSVRSLARSAAQPLERVAIQCGELLRASPVLAPVVGQSPGRLRFNHPMLRDALLARAAARAEIRASSSSTLPPRRAENVSRVKSTR